MHLNDLKSPLRVTAWLIWRDIRSLFSNFWSSILDATLLPTSIVLTGEYVMPLLGLPVTFGTFLLASSVIGMCFNSAGTDGNDLIADLESNRAISYELSLPTTYWLVCLKIGLGYAIKSFMLNLFILPVAFIVLPSLQFANFSVMKFTLIFASANILFGFWAVCVALWVKDSLGYGRFWIRWGWLLFVVGGYQFDWATMYRAMPRAALINLANPMVYAYEGMRAALMGGGHSINFWLCLAALWFFIVLFVFADIHLFKKRLDCV
jgi:ABC-2 type transport system permease protein